MAKLFKAGFKLLFQVFILLLPVQLAYHFWPEWAFVFGIRVDYLSPALYLTDILFLAVFLLFLITQRAGKKTLLWGLLGLGLVAALNIAFSSIPEPSFYKWIKLFEYFCLATVVAGTKDLKVGDWIVKPLTISMLGVSLIGILQVIKGGSMGGLLYFLGERSLDVSTPGIALTALGGREILRAYSTFSHPNSLAGFLGAGIILSWPLLLKKKDNFLPFAFLAIFTLGFLLTFSLAPAISLLFVAGLYLLFRNTPKLYSKLAKALLFIFVLLSIALPLFAARYRDMAKPFGESYTKRLELATVAGKMFSERPLLGQGLNNFVAALPEKSLDQPVAWWLQPVHNVFLLTLSETGLVGFLLIFLLFYLAIGKTGLSEKRYLAAALLFVVISGFFDHYWLTLQQNQLLLAIIFGLSFKNG